MLEIEQKYALTSFAPLETWLREQGIEPGPPQEEVDQYLNAPDRDFALTGEAFRLRRIGEQSYLTYKGPKQRQTVKSRIELEIPIPPGDEAATDFLRLLQLLGYRPVAVVRKTRRSCELVRGGFPITVTLDEVADLGQYAEVEILSPESQQDAARETVIATAAEIGLTRVEPRSYLRILLESRARQEDQGESS